MIRIFIWSLLSFVLIISPFLGSVHLNLADIFNYDTLTSNIFFNLRLPRVFFAFFAGSILSLSGFLFQNIFRNTLMTPYTLGISSGAVLGVGIAIKLGFGILAFGISTLSAFGFFGALLSVFLLIYLAQFLKNTHQESLLLLGIALSLFYSSALMVIFYLGNSIQNDILIRFTMGSLSVIGWQNPLLLSLMAFILFVSIYMYRFELQLLALSEEQAKLKGVDAKKVILSLLIIASLAIGVLVSISGPIGFIGLVVPHLVSKLYPLSIEHRIFKTALFGGLFLVSCDTIARSIQTQGELPIGIVTALIGVPLFIYLIISKQG